MLLDEEIRKLESEFYRVIYHITFNNNARKWMGKVRIQRKDTNEILRGGFRLFDEEKSRVETKIIEKLDNIKSDLLSLGVPYEWKSRGRLILVSYIKLRLKITEYGVSCDRVFTGEEDKEIFADKYAGFWLQIVEDTIAIVRNIEILSEQERMDILTLPESVFQDLSDPWNLDELDSRGDIIKFFLNPSENERNIHQTQTKKLIELYDQLDEKTRKAQ